jgi:hypothetical protein
MRKRLNDRREFVLNSSAYELIGCLICRQPACCDPSRKTTAFTLHKVCADNYTERLRDQIRTKLDEPIEVRRNLWKRSEEVTR